MPHMKLSICVPTAGTVPVEFALSLAGLVAMSCAKGLPSCPDTTLELSCDTVKSSVIHSNREQLVMGAIAAGKTHILFLDDDMEFDPRVLDILASRRHPIVCVNYRIKLENERRFVAVGLDGKRVETNPDSGGLLPVSYSGFGVSLFDLEVFKRTPQPWFAPEWVPDLKTYTTEDNPCYRRLREAGFTVYLDQDASKLVSHRGTKAFPWDERVRPAEVVTKKEGA